MGLVGRYTIEAWLDDAGLTYTPVALEDDAGLAWALDVRGQAFGTLVAGREIEPRRLQIQVAVDVSEPHRAAVAALDERSREIFLYDLRIAMYRTPVGHWIHFVDETSRLPRQVGVGMSLYEEELQRSGFLRRNHQLQSAAHIIALMFQKVTHMGTWP